jgi:hypothetical protein
MHQPMANWGLLTTKCASAHMKDRLSAKMRQSDRASASFQIQTDFSSFADDGRSLCVAE